MTIIELARVFDGHREIGQSSPIAMTNGFLAERLRTSLELIAAPMRTIIHENGFFKTVLVDIDEWPEDRFRGRKLVLHVWSSDAGRGAKEEIHNHRWSFWSVLLCGRLEWQHYDVEAERSGGSPYVEYDCGSPAGRDHFLLVRRRDTRLARRFRAIVTPGTLLHMSPSEVHRVRWIGTETAATLVLQERPARQVSNVYLPARGLANPTVLHRSVRHPDRRLMETTLGNLIRYIEP
jgi:hypothetical protein